MRRLSIPLVRLSVAVVVGFALAGSTARAEVFRTWTDASGKFTIKAKFVAVEDGKVTLEREDGTEIEIEPKRLGEADQKYLADRAKADENPFKAAASKDPFRAKSKSKAKAKDKGGMKVASGVEPTVVTPDWSKARVILPAPAAAEWKVAVGTTLAPAATSKARPVGLPPKGNFFERAKGLVVSPDGKMSSYNIPTWSCSRRARPWRPI